MIVIIANQPIVSDGPYGIHFMSNGHIGNHRLDRLQLVGHILLHLQCWFCILNNLLNRKEETNCKPMLKYNGGFMRMTWKGVMLGAGIIFRPSYILEVKGEQTLLSHFL